MRAAILSGVYAVFFILGFPTIPATNAAIDATLGLLERPFRSKQSWGLYGHGAPRVRRVEIRVDGRPVYRTEDPSVLDPALSDLPAMLKYRRIRPLVSTTASASRPKNWQGTVRFLASEVRARLPDARRVDIVVLEGEFPGTTLSEDRAYAAEAPAWRPVIVRPPRPRSGLDEGEEEEEE